MTPPAHRIALFALCFFLSTVLPLTAAQSVSQSAFSSYDAAFVNAIVPATAPPLNSSALSLTLASAYAVSFDGGLASALAPIGFPFIFYGVAYTAMLVNGGNLVFNNSAVIVMQEIIGDTIFFRTSGDVGERVFLLRVPFTVNSIIIDISLYEADGRVVMNLYAPLSITTALSIGIMGSTNDFALVTVGGTLNVSEITFTPISFTAQPYVPQSLPLNVSAASSYNLTVTPSVLQQLSPRSRMAPDQRPRAA